MRWITDILFRLRAIVTWGKMQRELDEEVAFHLEMETRKYIEQGLSEEEARRQALRNFGGVIRQKERARESWGVGLVQDLKADAGHTLRQLRRTPMFATVAIFTLALGIGGTTAIFSVVNGVLLKPLPFPNPHELVAVLHTASGVYVDEMPLSPAMYFTYREHSRTFEEIGLWKDTPLTVTGLAEPEQVRAVAITDGVFPLLGRSPALGRGYTAEDVSPGSEYPVILSRGYWLRRFGGDPSVLGRRIRVDGNDLEIIGVVPGGLRFGDLEPDLYVPLVFNSSWVAVGNFSFPGIARLRPGVTIEQANRDVARMNPLAVEQYGGKTLAELEEMKFATFVRPLKEDLVGEASTVLWVLFGTVGLVLLIACANVANLFLVRAEGRQRDVAVRTAMGASRSRLARQFLTESVVIGIIGGAVGLGLAYGGLRLLVRIAPESLPRLDEIAIDPAVLIFTLSVSVLAGLLFGLIPVLQYGRPNLVATLKEGGRGLSDGRQRHRLRNLFAVSQVALALVLLIGSGLMIRSFQALRNVQPGFERPEEVLTFRLSIPSAEAGAEEAARTHQRILERLEQIPGVTSASAAASVAMDGWESWDDVQVEEFPIPEDEVAPHRRLNWIAPDYFATLGNPILAGRSFDWDDIHNRRPVAVVTENFAREFWGEPSRAVGKRIRNASNAPWREIVGVVGNVHTRGVAEEPPAVIYWPMLMERMWGSRIYVQRSLRYALRTSRPSAKSLLPEVREAVWSINRNLPLSEVQTLDEILAQSMARTSFTLVMLGIAAAVALLLGVVGVYGVISYVVAQRTREIGVRMALGARREDVTRLVLGQGGLVGATGVAIGLAAAVGLTRLMSALLFGVNPVDPLTYGAVSAGLAGVVLLASYIPARRAASVDPTEALRWE